LCGIDFQGQYSLAKAQQSFKSLVQIHEKNGECDFVDQDFRGNASSTVLSDAFTPFAIVENLHQR